MDAILQYDPRNEETLYEVLGCDRLSTVEQINVEYKLKALKYHPDKNPGDVVAMDDFSKLQRARDILLNPVKRKQYDTWLTSGLHIPYDEWARMKDSVKMTMHWSTVKTDPMLKGTKDQDESQNVEEKTYNNDQGSMFAGWKRKSKNDTINKFRNYEI